MPERLPQRPLEEHPVAAGLIALVGVGVVVGLILGFVVFAGTKVLGLGEGTEESGADGHATMYLPTPVKTTASSDPQITLAPGVSPASSEPAAKSPSATKSPEREITLSASVTETTSMQQFELTGLYPQGEGAILTVQRFEGGAWVDFPANGSVAGEQFQIPVQTSRPGVNRFRVVDSDSGLQSGEVRVTVTG